MELFFFFLQPPKVKRMSTGMHGNSWITPKMDWGTNVYIAHNQDLEFRSDYSTTVEFKLQNPNGD